METLLLTDQRPRQTIVRLPIRVPRGHELPEGHVVQDPFNVIVEAGVRWHPEWDEPRVTVNAWRFFAHGDALVAAGVDVTALYGALLPQEVKNLAVVHGRMFVAVGGDEIDKAVRDEVAKMKLAPPRERQAISTFIAVPERRMN